MCDNLNQEENVQEVQCKKEVYRIHENFMDELEKRMKRIQKKFEKYGNEFTYEVVDSEMINIETDKNKEPNYQKFFLVKADGKALINNWEFIAVLEPRGDENIIRRYNTEVELPIRFRNAKNICEHCNTDRRRNELFVVRNTVTNEIKQIGKSCLKEYTNGLSAEHVALLMQFAHCLNDYEEQGLGLDFSGGFYRHYEVKDILAHAIVCTDNFGFLSSSYENSTVNKVRELLSSFRETTESWEKVYNISINENDLNNDTIKARAEAIIDYYLTLDDNSEFIHNVKVILKDDYCKRKDFGIIACLPNCYNKAMNKIVEQTRKDAVAQLSEHYGIVGKRYSVENVFLERVTLFDTFYGLMFIYRFIDSDNHVFVWKTSNSFDNGYHDIKYTIKEHNEFKGIKQTEVSRCKLIERKQEVNEVKDDISKQSVDKAIDEFLEFCNQA